MPNLSSAPPNQNIRLILLLSLILSSVLVSGCGLFGARKKVQVPPLLTPLVEADKARLIAEVNRLAALRSIHGRVDIVFEDTSFAEVGISEKYRQADGTVTLQRPGQVYLVIQIPFIATDIAQMTSNGQTFRVAVLQGDEKYKRFVKGTNDAVYDKLEVNGAPEPDKSKKRTMTGKETVTALSNLRPQHLTEALMISPIPEPTQSGLLYVRSEAFQEEPDTRPNANKTARVVRGYYALEEISQPASGEARLLRRLWFDRVSGIRLARIQTFDERGMLITDVSYRDEKPLGTETQVRLPTRIEITRPHDKYKLSITYQDPTAVVINREYQAEAFVLQNRWQLPEVDLDERKRNKVNVSP